jgi:hypothetical protein
MQPLPVTGKGFRVVHCRKSFSCLAVSVSRRKQRKVPFREKIANSDDGQLYPSIMVFQVVYQFLA